MVKPPFNIRWAWLAITMCMFLNTTGGSEDETPKLQDIVIVLQNQITALQQEQLENRVIIQSLESRLNEHTARKSRRVNRVAKNVDPTPQPLITMHGTTTSTSEDTWTHVDQSLSLNSHSIRMLEKERRDLSRLDVHLKDLQRELSEVVRSREREVGIVEATGDLRAEWDAMRGEVQRLRQAVEELRARSEEEQEQLGQLRSGHITTKWLQKTVEDVRREMAELAAALNISMALRQRQQLEAGLTQVRTDVATLRTDVEHGTAVRAREVAALEQLKREVAEVRLVAQTVSMEQQHLAEEVSTIKEELLSSYASGSSITPPPWADEKFVEENVKEEGSGDELISPFFTKDPPNSHLRHQHLKFQIETMREDMMRYKKKYALLEKELHNLKHNYSSTYASLGNVERITSHLTNQTTSWKLEHLSLARQLDQVQGHLQLVEERTAQNGKNIVNVTEAVTGMDKVHSSTVQLFEALESIEEEFSRNIGELQKEVSKFEFNVAQIQSSFDILRHDQSTYYEDMKVLKTDFSSLQSDVQKDHYRLITIQNDVLNQSLKQCHQGNQESLQDLKLANLELRMAKLGKKADENKEQLQNFYGKLLQKVDRTSVIHLEGKQKELLEDIRTVFMELPKLEHQQSHVKHEMMKFTRQLPKDCSMEGVPNPASEYHSGVYLIHVPHTERVQEVFCDIISNGHRWTVIQRRTDGSEDFFRGWDDYKRGFGKPEGEYWLGNDNLHQLTSQKNYTLRIDMWDVFDNYIYAEYDAFHVASENDLYRLNVGQYRGNASDALKHHHQMAFSTRDRDNDASSSHCAMYYSGGWWYQHCQYVNVNGRYAIGMTWYDSANHDWVQLARVEMKIATVS